MNQIQYISDEHENVTGVIVPIISGRRVSQKKRQRTYLKVQL